MHNHPAKFGRSKLYFVGSNRHAPLNCRGAVTFCLDTKSNQKNQVIRQLADSLPHWPLPANQEKPRAVPTRAGTGRTFYSQTLHAKTCYALCHHTGLLFFLISPEAYLLTGITYPRLCRSCLRQITLVYFERNFPTGCFKTRKSVWQIAGGFC
jgi:hypothetical protein